MPVIALAVAGTIAFSATNAHGVPQLFTVAAAGGRPQPLHLRGEQPAYAADGGRLVYRRPAGEGNELVVARADGTRARVLVPAAGRYRFHEWPLWSRDGRLVAYRAWGVYGPELAFAVPAAGGAPRLLRGAELSGWAPPGAGYAVDTFAGITWHGRGVTVAVAGADLPTWSPVRRELAYVVGGRIGVLDTVSRRRRVVASTGCPRGTLPERPAWSPDGGRLAYFACTPSRTLRIVSRDGATVRDVAKVARGSGPTWRR